MIHNFAAFVQELAWDFGFNHIKVNLLPGTYTIEVIILNPDRPLNAILVTLYAEIVGDRNQYKYEISKIYGGGPTARYHTIASIEETIVRALNKSVETTKYGRVYGNLDQARWWS